MDVQTIELSQLKPWPKNPRQGNPDVTDLVASIKAEGLLQPLIVAKNGDGYYVIAGNRRFKALQVAEWHNEDRGVPCHVLPDGLDDDRLLEVALAENVIRLDMHPIDECEAFAKLAAEGKDIAGVAAAFNVSERYVRQRLLLGSLPDAVRIAYRKGEIEHRDAIALARLNDPKLAAKAYKAAVKSGTDIGWNASKAAGEEGRFYVAHAKFEVPASLKTTEDFFDADREGKPRGPYFIDFKKAHALQAAWVAAQIKEKRASGAWAFVEIGTDDYSKYRRAGETEKKGVGLLYRVDRSGEVVEQRVVSLAAERKAEKEKAQAKKAKQAKKAGGEPAAEVESAELPHSLKRDIEALRVAAVMIAVTEQPALLDLDDILATPPRLGVTCHQDVVKECEAVIEDLRAKRDPRALLALYVEPYKVEDALKKSGLNEHAAYGEVDWPKSLLARLPRPALELEAKALGVTDYGAGTKKGELVEKVWKAKPEHWVPVFACNG